jgi:putative ABC transport system substrate-binding protein
MKSKKLWGMIVLLFATCTANVFAAAGKPLKIALITWRGETEAEKGFKDGLKDLGHEVTYQEFDAQQDMTRLSTLLKNEVDPQQFDYLYTFGTSASVRVSKEYEEKTPQVFNIVNYPDQVELVKSLEAPGRNISGATNLIPIEKEIQTLHSIFKFKKLGAIYNPREKNLEISLQQLRDLAPKYGFTVEAYRIIPETDTLKEFIQGVEKGEITADIFRISVSPQSEEITRVLTKAKIPSFSSIEEVVKKKGALMGLTSSYYDLGKAVAFIVDQNQKGMPLAEIPVAKPTSFTVLINKKTAEALGISFDPAIIQGAQWIE